MKPGRKSSDKPPGKQNSMNNSGEKSEEGPRSAEDVHQDGDGDTPVPTPAASDPSVQTRTVPSQHEVDGDESATSGSQADVGSGEAKHGRKEEVDRKRGSVRDVDEDVDTPKRSRSDSRVEESQSDVDGLSSASGSERSLQASTEGSQDDEEEASIDGSDSGDEEEGSVDSQKKDDGRKEADRKRGNDRDSKEDVVAPKRSRHDGMVGSDGMVTRSGLRLRDLDREQERDVKDAAREVGIEQCLLCTDGAGSIMLLRLRSVERLSHDPRDVVDEQADGDADGSESGEDDDGSERSGSGEDDDESDRSGSGEDDDESESGSEEDDGSESGSEEDDDEREQSESEEDDDDDDEYWSEYSESD